VNAAGSMPIGNGEVGANVWVDAATGELCCYLAAPIRSRKPGRLLSSAKVPAEADAEPFVASKPFAQRLHLASGCNSASSRRCHLAVGAAPVRRCRKDVVHVTASAVSRRGDGGRRDVAHGRQAARRAANSTRRGPCTVRRAGARECASRPTGVGIAGTPALPAESLAWSHHNAHSIVPATLALQGLAMPRGP